MSALDLSYFLHKRANDLNLSATTIAKLAGISRQTWYRLINAEIQQARIETLVSISHVLQVSLMELSYLYTKKPKFSHQLLSKSSGHSDAYSLIRDKSHPINSMISCNKTFRKEWEIINLGEEEWVGRKLVCVNNEMSIQLRNASTSDFSKTPIDYLNSRQGHINIPTTAPGDVVTLSATLTAPEHSSTAISLWKIVDQNNRYCFADDVDLLCQVRVVGVSTPLTSEIAKVA